MLFKHHVTLCNASSAKKTFARNTHIAGVFVGFTSLLFNRYLRFTFPYFSIKKIYFLLFSLIFVSCFVQAQNYSINTFNYSWCTNTYPTAYVTGSWAIAETDISGNFGLTKNQTNKTFIVDLPAGFEFKTAATTANVTIGPLGVSPIDAAYDFSSVSFVFTSTTRITVTLTAKNQQLEYNSLNFNSFEIRATAIGSGTIIRNGGNFKVDNSNLPTTAEPFGTLTAAAPFVYSGTVVTQDQNGVNIPQYTINNTILRINITGTNSCNGTLTQFDFNTVGDQGTDLASNISVAKVYFTGTSSVFATTSLFGSLASPSGAFSITGSQALVGSVDNYFWLTFDVPGDANTDGVTPLNRLDAKLDSFVLNASTITTGFTTPNPTGYRPIIGASFYYSREVGTWNDNLTRWSTSDGGPACFCQPNGSGVAVIKHLITLDVNRAVDVVEIRDLASLANNGTDKKLTAYTAINTLGSGYFDLRAKPLLVGGNVSLSGTGTSTNSEEIDIGGDLTVGVGTILQSSTNNKHIYIGGNLNVNGTLRHNATNGDIYMDGGFFSLTGTGGIGPVRTFILTGGNKTIPAAANLIVTSTTTKIEGAHTITNNGTMTLQANLDGNNASSQWTNAASSTLNYSGASMPFITSGVLEAVATTNTVNYTLAGNQTIVRPNNSGQYNNLTLSTSGTKTLNQNIQVSGNFINNASFDANVQSVTFNGSTAQSISGTAASTAFQNLTINNTSATGVTLSQPVSVAGIFTLTDGYFYTDNTSLLNMNAGSSVSAVSNSSFVYGPMAKTGNTNFTFPVGKDIQYRPIAITSLSGSETFTAEYFHSDPNLVPYDVTLKDAALDHIGRCEYWILNRAGAVNAFVNLSWDSYSCGVDNLTDIAAARWDGALWRDHGNGGTTGAVDPGTGTVITSAIVTAFSPFTLASKTINNPLTNIIPLPIELLSFNAAVKNKTVQLRWTTASEINNDYFTVEKTIDGIEFQEVKKVKGAGNSSHVLNYSAIDEAPFTGLNYYRLKQTDFDSKFSYSDLVGIKVEMDIEQMNVYPNPLKKGQNLNIALSGKNEKEILVVLMDMMGNEYYSKVVVLDQSQTTIVMDLFHKLSPGVYMVTGSSNDLLFSKRIVVQ